MKNHWKNCDAGGTFWLMKKLLQNFLAALKKTKRKWQKEQVKKVCIEKLWKFKNKKFSEKKSPEDFEP